MVSYSAKLDHRTKQQHTQFGVSASNGSRDMARTKVAEKKKKERRQNYIASPTGIANNVLFSLSSFSSSSIISIANTTMLSVFPPSLPHSPVPESLTIVRPLPLPLWVS